MIKKYWYFKNNCEAYSVLYQDNIFMLVMNDRTKLYSFGTKDCFGSLYGFPVDQSCLTKNKTIEVLNDFIEIDKNSNLNNCYSNTKVWENMIKSLN